MAHEHPERELIIHPWSPDSTASWFFSDEPDDDVTRQALREAIEALLAEERARWDAEHDLIGFCCRE